MSHADTAGRAPGASRFANIKAALAKRDRYLNHQRRRRPRSRFELEPGFGGTERWVAETFRKLMALAEPIALDPTGKVHVLMTVPNELLDDAFRMAGIEEDQDTGDDEPSGNMVESPDAEASIAVPDAILDQSIKLPTAITVGDTWQHADQDLELDPSEHEPSLGSLDGEINQERWATGDRLDRERGEGGADCDDDEPDHDNEPEPLEPSLSSVTGADHVTFTEHYEGEEAGYMHNPADAAIRAKLRLQLGIKTPRQSMEIVPEVVLAGPSRPDGKFEMVNQTTGKSYLWQPLPRNGGSR